MQLFWGFARQSFSVAAMYRLEFWTFLLGNFSTMYGAYWLWNTLYLRSPETFSTSLEQMLTYAMLAMALDVILYPANLPRYYINDAVRTGSIQMDMLRPLDFTFHMLARAVGQFGFSLLGRGLPVFVLGALFLGLRLPADPLNALLFVPSLVLGFLVAFALSYLVGLVSIFAIQARRISWFFFAVLRFFSGQMVPLWYFPPLLAQAAALLPFQAIIGLPLSIYIGRLSPAEAASALALQALWAAALLALGNWVWQQAYAHLTLQGG